MTQVQVRGASIETLPAEPAEPYVIAMPVPNITGELHVGHALNLVVQDVFARHLRRTGRQVVFRPGVDHAGLSGQLAAERALRARDQTTRQELGRDSFRTYMQEWHDQHQGLLLRQMRQLGVSADWDTPVSSVDAPRRALVAEMFVKLHRLGLVYHEQALVSWCTGCETCIPDHEIGRAEVTRTAYLLTVTDEHGGSYQLATLRPHLLFGATAVVAPPGHPALGVAEVRLPALDLTLPVTRGGSTRERTLGRHLSAVVPCYNADDFDAAHGTGSPVVNLFAADGTLSLPGGEYDGLAPQECDKVLVAHAERSGVLAGTEPYLHGDARHTSCGGQVIPRVSRQWFIRVAGLTDTARRLLAEPVTRFNHPRWEERYRAGLSAVLDEETSATWWEGACLAFVRGFSSNRDWVVSRQNWWGIPVPAWHCAACDSTVVTAEATPPRCDVCGAAMNPSPDVLDVLFHSALWATCVTTDLSRGYHADLAVIGHDILEFWIPTANLLSAPLFGSGSIRDVFVHGVIAASDGRKMSKSAGNALGLDQLLSEHGTDMVRSLMLDLVQVAGGEESVRLSEDHVARAVARVDRLRRWCGSVTVTPLAGASAAGGGIDRRLADARSAVDAAFARLDPGGAYRRTIELVDQLPSQLTARQAGDLAGLLAPFHPDLAATFEKRTMR